MPFTISKRLPASLLPAEDHFIQIYKNKAAAYHALVAAEDAAGRLLPALQAITPLAGKRVLDPGSGTGRIPLLLKDIDCRIISVDLHHPMLTEQAQHFPSLREGEAKRSRAFHGRNLPDLSATTADPAGAPHLLQADLRRLPLASSWADVITAGWAIGHFTGWYGSSWISERIALSQRCAAPPNSAAR